VLRETIVERAQADSQLSAACWRCVFCSNHATADRLNRGECAVLHVNLSTDTFLPSSGPPYVGAQSTMYEGQYDGGE